MIYVSLEDLANRLDEVTERAREETVVLTELGERRLVVLSSEEYERLRGREVFLSKDLPDFWSEELLKVASTPYEVD